MAREAVTMVRLGRGGAKELPSAYFYSSGWAGVRNAPYNWAVVTCSKQMSWA